MNGQEYWGQILQEYWGQILEEKPVETHEKEQVIKIYEDGGRDVLNRLSGIISQAKFVTRMIEVEPVLMTKVVEEIKKLAEEFKKLK